MHEKRIYTSHEEMDNVAHILTEMFSHLHISLWSIVDDNGY
jgi:hypothetical protein